MIKFTNEIIKEVLLLSLDSFVVKMYNSYERNKLALINYFFSWSYGRLSYNVLTFSLPTSPIGDFIAHR